MWFWAAWSFNRSLHLRFVKNKQYHIQCLYHVLYRLLFSQCKQSVCGWRVFKCCEILHSNYKWRDVQRNEDCSRLIQRNACVRNVFDASEDLQLALAFVIKYYCHNIVSLTPYQQTIIHLSGHDSGYEYYLLRSQIVRPVQQSLCSFISNWINI